MNVDHLVLQTIHCPTYLSNWWLFSLLSFVLFSHSPWDRTEMYWVLSDPSFRTRLTVTILTSSHSSRTKVGTQTCKSAFDKASVQILRFEQDFSFSRRLVIYFFEKRSFGGRRSIRLVGLGVRFKPATKHRLTATVVPCSWEPHGCSCHVRLRVQLCFLGWLLCLKSSLSKFPRERRFFSFVHTIWFQTGRIEWNVL
jgi:hypothetical protein